MLTEWVVVGSQGQVGDKHQRSSVALNSLKRQGLS